MIFARTSLLIALAALFSVSSAIAADSPKADEGFQLLFDGKTLDGWYGLAHTNPAKLEAMSEEERNALKEKNAKDVAEHWKVENGEIINDGHGVFLTTEKDYADFQLKLDWKMVGAHTDSGIYLRGCPQVQIWDPSNPGQFKNGNQKGSGGLWNNNPNTPGKDPLVKADHPVGEWNSLDITMQGERVTVILNGQTVVDNAVMHNYWNRKEPILESGPIQLQTHGGEMRFRNLMIREISE